MYHVVFTNCDRQEKIFVIAGLILRWDGQNQLVISGFSQYSEVCFHIFYCYSTGLLNVVRYNGVFVIAGCHCSLVLEGFVVSYFATPLMRKAATARMNSQAFFSKKADGLAGPAKYQADNRTKEAGQNVSYFFFCQELEGHYQHRSQNLLVHLRLT